MIGAAKIGQVAQKTGLSIDTIRFYEKQGLIGESARTEGGFRLFGSGEIETLKFVRKAQELGFSLSEIRELLILRADKTSEWFVQPDSRRRGIPESGKRLCESS